MTTIEADVRGARVLVLEDDFYLATDLQMALQAAGADVVGPFSEADEAAAAVAKSKPDCALVDLNLGRGPSFDIPRKLAELEVPFAFVTGYDPRVIPAEFADVLRFAKPVDTRQLVRTVGRLLRRS